MVDGLHPDVVDLSIFLIQIYPDEAGQVDVRRERGHVMTVSAEAMLGMSTGLLNIPAPAYHAAARTLWP
ncbi:hypothetical protein GCM10009658_67840 [Planotetraspora silvatica]